MSFSAHLKRWARWIHLYSALVLFIPLVAIGVTGSILVYEDEIMAVVDPAATVRVASTGSIASLDRLLAAGQGAAPNNARATSLSLPAGEGLPATVGFGTGRGGPQVLIDPVSAEVVGTRNGPPRGPGLMRDIFLLHANLLNYVGGRDTVGWLGVVMCVIGLTGLIMWWPRRGHYAKAFLIARGIRGQRLLSELHGATGIWTFAIFMIVSFSGVYLAFPRETGALIRAVFPSADVTSAARSLRVVPEGTALSSLDRIAAIARASVPDAEVRALALAAQPDHPYRVTMSTAHGAPAIAVYIDPYAQRAAAIVDPRTYPLGEKMAAWQRPLHEGEGLGPVFKFLVFLSGFLPPLFAVTGIWMWLIRRRRRLGAPKPPSSALST